MKASKQDILENARVLFVKKGYKDTNISDITKNSGIAVGSFYKFYKSKDEVFLEVFMSENDCLTRRIMDTVDLNQDPVIVIKAILLKLFSGIADNPILREWYGKDIYNKLEDHYMKYGNTGSEYVYNLFSDLIRKWQNEGKLRKDIECDMIMAIMNSFQYIELHKELIGSRYFPHLTEYMIEFVVSGLKT